MNTQPMNKENWIKFFRTIGLDDKTMTQWHKEFEKSYPEGHQSFLESLGITEEDIKSIRTAK